MARNKLPPPQGYGVLKDRLARKVLTPEQFLQEVRIMTGRRVVRSAALAFAKRYGYVPKSSTNVEAPIKTVTRASRRRKTRRSIGRIIKKAFPRRHVA